MPTLWALGMVLEPLLHVLQVATMRASLTPSVQSPDGLIANAAIRALGRFAFPAIPTGVRHGFPAFAAIRVHRRGLLVQFPDAIDPGHVDDFGRFAPHLLAVQQLDVGQQPAFLFHCVLGGFHNIFGFSRFRFVFLHRLVRQWLARSVARPSQSECRPESGRLQRPSAG